MASTAVSAAMAGSAVFLVLMHTADNQTHNHD